MPLIYERPPFLLSIDAIKADFNFGVSDDDDALCSEARHDGTNGVNPFFLREVAKTLFCHVPVWWEACTRRTPTQSWHPLD